MHTRLTLIAHAPTAATRAARFPDDEPPDEHGRAQVTAVAGTLHRVDDARCGPETRCRQTAEMLGLDATVDPSLADMQVGAWRGRGWDDLQHAEPAAIQAWLTEPSAAPPGGECRLDLLDRVGRWLDTLHAAGGHVVAITHPALIRAAVIHILAAPPQAFWRLDVAPPSHTRLSSNAGHWTVRETGHALAARR